MNNKSLSVQDKSYTLAGMFTLALRLVTGWTYFSAFWRRLILENKLDPGAAGYIGEKFNHFLPSALLVGPSIEYLVTHENLLWWAMLAFTIIEAIAGLFFMLGLFTRATSVVVAGLAMSILLGAGWLGTTCLDEWQIGVLGVAAGFTIFLSGGGRYSLDHYFGGRFPAWISSGALAIKEALLKKIVWVGAMFILALTLFTNQYFHGGVWGTLHNKSVRPHIEISDAALDPDALQFTIYRVEGADVYGSFLIGVRLKDEAGNTVFEADNKALAAMDKRQIANDYVTKVKPGKHSLVVPLGAKARLNFSDSSISKLPSAGTYTLELTDISGITWQQQVEQ